MKEIDEWLYNMRGKMYDSYNTLLDDYWYIPTVGTVIEDLISSPIDFQTEEELMKEE